eukprot:6484731-Amphidinium_carterae.1
MGAKTGRGTGFKVENPYVLKRTLDPDYAELMELAHALAKTHERSISYTSLVVTKLATGEKLNSHVDDKNHGNIPNHTFCFGDYKGGQLQVERPNQNGVKEWQIVGVSKTWVSFYAKSLTHRVTKVTEGTRYSVTYYTPGNLDLVPQGDWDYLQQVGFPIDEVIARIQFFGMTLYRGVTAARQGETTDTSSTSEQKPVSFGSVVSKVTAPATEEKSIPSTSAVHGCHLCGHQEGGSCCSMCNKTACSQHIRVKIDQKAQQALPICRSCSFLDEATRLAGLESLPLSLHELTGGIKALDCLCASATTQPNGSAKSFQDVLSDRMGLSEVEETDPSGILARAAVT